MRSNPPLTGTLIFVQLGPIPCLRSATRSRAVSHGMTFEEGTSRDLGAPATTYVCSDGIVLHDIPWLLPHIKEKSGMDLVPLVINKRSQNQSQTTPNLYHSCPRLD
ncbi:hypothetical protein K440DRAFT_82840 [Wilcoxina mikolae CBS 423.85]|nr:hypothetical protein K440DRAFT_82840 [Wilcoxina mikolae CBS 423.85]